MRNILHRIAAFRSAPVVRDEFTIVLITHDYQASITLLIAGFQQSWQVSIATSVKQAQRRIRRHGAAVLVYDLESHEADWRTVREVARENRLDFHVIAREPDDDLSIAVIAAGGVGLWSKPLKGDQIVGAVRFGRILSS